MLAAVFFGCASLPEFKPWSVSKSSEKRVVGADSVLSPEQSAAVLRRLKEQGRDDLLTRHIAYVEAISGAPLIGGNQVRLLVDGPATFAAMFRAMRAARDHINLETYILRDDWLGQRLAEVLLEKRRQGVEVNLIYDSIGTLLTSREFFQRLADGGVNLCEFNPVNPIRGGILPRLNHRDHRKILVVDGAIAFTGGINFDSVYGSSSSSLRRGKQAARDEGWRDTQIEIRGPAAAEFQRLFLDTWEKQGGAQLAPRNYFPKLEREGDTLVRVIGSSPDDREAVIYLAMLSAIEHADRTVYITMAYFVPDRRMIEAITGAARRGVDVQMIMPGFSDHWIVFHAGRSHYDELLAAGVEIYERRDALVHAKTAVIDGVWSTVGSANMDMRSFLHNDEVNAVVLSNEFAREMYELFAADRKQAKRIDAESWAGRPSSLRLKEWFGRLWEYWL